MDNNISNEQYELLKELTIQKKLSEVAEGILRVMIENKAIELYREGEDIKTRPLIN